MLQLLSLLLCLRNERLRLDVLCLRLGLDSSLEETRFLRKRSFELTDTDRDRDVLSLVRRRNEGDFFFEYLFLDRFDDL